MWIKLTRIDEQPVLVNVVMISDVIVSAKGSIIRFDKRLTGSAKKLAVMESVPVIAAFIGVRF